MAMANNRIDEKAKCPFYLRSFIGRAVYGIECEGLIDEDKLGFSATHFTRFEVTSEMKDYAELFCQDMYKTCPYYKAVTSIKYKNGHG